jgi:hypothetical protein
MPLFELCAGLLLGDIKGLWRVALVLSSVLSVPLDEGSITERANNCLLVETSILKLGEELWYLIKIQISMWN